MPDVDASRLTSVSPVNPLTTNTAGEPVRLTEARVRAISANGKQQWHRDAGSPLKLMVSAKGAKSFYVERRVNGRPRRVRIGGWPDLTVEDARRRAQAEAGHMAAGIDPNARRKEAKRVAAAKSYTFGEAFEDYLQLGGKQGGKTTRGRKASTVAEYHRLIDRHVEDWKARPLADIDEDAVLRVYRQVGKKSGEATANGLMRVVRAVMKFAASRRKIALNPVEVLRGRWYESNERDGKVSADRLPAWWDKLAELRRLNIAPAHAVLIDAATMIVLTGMRRNEALTMRWANVGDDLLTVQETKNDRPLTLPITPPMRATLDRCRERDGRSKWVFPSPGKRGSRAGHAVELRGLLDTLETAGFDHTTHDLRRTFSNPAALLVPGPVLKSFINHKLRKSSDVTERHYIRLEPEQLRPHLETVQKAILGERWPDPFAESPRQTPADASDGTGQG